MGMYPGEYDIPLRVVVKAETGREALDKARHEHEAEWAFDAEDFVETVTGYLWMAADGSSVSMTLRKLPDPQ